MKVPSKYSSKYLSAWKFFSHIYIMAWKSIPCWHSSCPKDFYKNFTWEIQFFLFKMMELISVLTWNLNILHNSYNLMWIYKLLKTRLGT